jgi:hypothetical protein
VGVCRDNSPAAGTCGARTNGRAKMKACEHTPTTARDRIESSGAKRDRRAARRQRLACPARLFIILAGAVSCNSLLGIGEASLNCDALRDQTAPNACDQGPPGRDVTASEAPAPDGGTAPLGASGSSNTVGAGGVPASSGAARDGVPVAPESPPQSARPDDTGSANGAPASGGSGAGGAVPIGSAAGDGSAGMGGASSGPAGEAGGVVCSGDDPCGACLCEDCEVELAACTDTPGCIEILVCARNTGCSGFTCYCGTADLFSCATTDLANGPCLAVMLAAPGSHPPSVLDPNAGPASEAALGVSDCSEQRCVASCGN